jgi:hypothetical protein
MIIARSPEERLKMGCSMFDTARALARAGIQHSHPDFTEPQIRGKLLVRFYGRDFTVDELKKIAARMPSVELDPEDLKRLSRP